jgi:PAS domain S-box-containing protein
MNEPYQPTQAATARGPDATSVVTACPIDDIPAAFGLIGFDGRIRRINAVWSQLLGQRPTFLVGKSFARIIHPDDARLLAGQWCDVEGEALPEAFEARFCCSDGSHKWFYCQAKPIAAQRVFAIVAVETSQRKETEIIAKRRAAVASLRADVWAALGSGASSDQILGIWTELVRRHLELVEVQIWTRAADGGDLVLQARSAAQDGAFDSTLFEPEVRQAGETDSPLMIPDAAADPRFEPRFERTRSSPVRGVILHPVRTVEHVIAILVAVFNKACGPQETALIETVAVDMGDALQRLVREEDLLEARRDRDRLLGTAIVGFCRVDAEQQVVAWSGGAERLLGWNAHEMLGRRLVLATQESGPALDDCLAGALVGRATDKLETKVLARDGQTVDVALSIAPLIDGAGNVNGAWLTIGDLNDRKRSERFLDLQRRVTEILAKSRSAAEATKTLLGTIGASLGFEVGEFWEPDGSEGAVRRTASWHSSTEHATEFDLASGNREDERPPQLVQQVLDGGTVRCLRGFSTSRDLERSELAQRCGIHDAIGMPIPLGESQRGVVLFFAGEISEQETARAAFLSVIAEQFGQFLQFQQTRTALDDARQDVLQATKMDTVGRLVGGVAHDFNNLLTIILGYGEMVLEDCEGGDPKRDQLEEILGAGKRAAGLTRQLLGFCRKEVAEPIAVDLNAHVTEMQKMIGRLIGEQISLATQLAPNLGSVRADPAHIEQMIMNLVVNARDAMPNGGDLTIATRTVEPGDRELGKFSRVGPGRYALLSVSDSGCGIDEATRKRIFEPFFTTKGSGKGVGMGLATVADLVRKYGGRIAVESARGRGTTFSILLPAMPQGLASWQIDSTPDVVPRGDETILLVEDDDRVRQLISRGLGARGYTVLAAGDAAQGLELHRQQAAEIDLLIADVRLPGMKGPELVSRIAQTNASLTALYISGYAEDEIRRSGVLGGDAPYLQKPFSIHDLARKIRELCNRAAQ